MQINVMFWSLGRDVRIQLLLRRLIEMLKSLIALKRNYLEFILIANSPLTITSRNFAKKSVIKLYALARISPHMDHNKLRILMRAFITSHFQYYHLVGMFHNRQLNEKINKIHIRALNQLFVT